MAKAHLESPRESVIPAKAGIHFDFDNSNLDPGFRRDDGQKQRPAPTRLGDIANFRNGLNFTKDDRGAGCPYVGVPDFSTQGALDYSRLAQINAEEIASHEDYLRNGDIVFVRSNGNKELVGRSIYIQSDLPALFSGFCIRARLDTERIWPLFVYYFSKSSGFRKQLSGTGGSNINNLNQTVLGDVRLPEQSLAEQKKIAAVLSMIDAKIDLNNRISAELEALAKTIYDYWFVQFDFPDADGRPYKSSAGAMVWNDTLKREIPAGWVDDVLGNIVENLDSKRVPLSRQQREQRSGSVPYYGATGLMGYVDDFLFDEDLLLLAEDGSVMDDRGKVIVQRVWGKAWVNNHAHVLRPSSGWTVDLLYHALRDVSAVRMVSGSIQKKITQDNLSATRLLVPPESLRRSLARSLRPIRERQKEASEESAVLTRLRDWLLPLLMNGQVRVASSDAASAPASEPVAEPA